MINNFERLRKRLDYSIEKNGINSDKTKRLSERFDKMVNNYYKNEKQYKEDSIIHIKYLESIQRLKRITKDFVKFPTINDWNHYAKEKNLLNSESLKYISGNNWNNLRNRILSELKNM